MPWILIVSRRLKEILESPEFQKLNFEVFLPLKRKVVLGRESYSYFINFAFVYLKDEHQVLELEDALKRFKARVLKNRYVELEEGTKGRVYKMEYKVVYLNDSDILNFVNTMLKEGYVPKCYKVGTEVEIVEGPLKGLRGVIVGSKKNKVLLRIDLLKDFSPVLEIHPHLIK